MSAEIYSLTERTSNTANGLLMPVQNFASAFVDPGAPPRPSQRRQTLPRLLVFVTAPLVGVSGAAFLLHHFDADGTLELFEVVLSLTTAFLMAWESLAAATALLGFYAKTPTLSSEAKTDMRIAILLPLYGEDAANAIGNTTALLRSLTLQTRHHFSLHILSDTRDATQVHIEREIFFSIQYRFPHLDVFYYHRQQNTDHKAGNIKTWIERDAASYDAIVVLDADSVMTGEAVLQMVDQLAGDAACGLVQTLPRIMGVSNFWQWTQSFATTTYGQVLGNGMASWMGDEGNYYGHNAIIRTKAFAACAGLPLLQIAAESQETIMSHDFVEAALLRRGGWSVQFAPHIEGSFETTPQTLMGFITRDARWCYGNLQHLRLLGAVGLHPLSRWHLFHGAMTYLTSILWLITMVMWAAIEQGAQDPTHFLPLYLPVAVAALVLLPKLVGFLSHLAEKSNRQNLLPFAGDFLIELLASTFIAPALMIHRLRAIIRYAAGVRCEWQQSDRKSSLGETFRFHLVEAMTGLICATLVGAGILSLLILPVALCLLLAPVFSYATSRQSKSFFHVD